MITKRVGSRSRYWGARKVNGDKCSKVKWGEAVGEKLDIHHVRMYGADSGSVFSRIKISTILLSFV